MEGDICNTSVNKPIDLSDYVDLSYSRVGQDVRNLGWKPKRLFDNELHKIVEYYKENFIW